MVVKKLCGLFFFLQLFCDFVTFVTSLLSSRCYRGFCVLFTAFPWRLIMRVSCHSCHTHKGGHRFFIFQSLFQCVFEQTIAFDTVFLFRFSSPPLSKKTNVESTSHPTSHIPPTPKPQNITENAFKSSSFKKKRGWVTVEKKWTQATINSSTQRGCYAAAA
jgi:hypothetical protein